MTAKRLFQQEHGPLGFQPRQAPQGPARPPMSRPLPQNGMQCQSCRGSGRVGEMTCYSCHGNGSAQPPQRQPPPPRQAQPGARPIPRAESKATGVVDKLLEYGFSDEPPRAGQPNDPWRQAPGPIPLKKPLPKLDFTGSRTAVPMPAGAPGAPGAPVDPMDDVEPPPMDAPLGTPVPIKHVQPVPPVHPRFKWRPPA